MPEDKPRPAPKKNQPEIAEDVNGDGDREDGQERVPAGSAPRSTSQEQGGSFRRFTKRRWPLLVSSGLTIFFGILAYYYADLAYAKREPAFVVDPTRVLIVDAEVATGSLLKVVRSDNKPIKGDVSSARIYFWNQGRQSIVPGHVLKDLKINIADAEILDFRVLSQSRPEILQASLSRDPEDGEHALIMSFQILEENDGFCAQINYEGKRDTQITLSGAIEGVKSFVPTPNYWRWAHLIVLYMVGGVSVFTFFQFLNRPRRSSRSCSYFGGRFSPTVRTVLALLGIVAGIVGIVTLTILVMTDMDLLFRIPAALRP